MEKKIFVRMDIRNEEKDMTSADYQAHLSYLREIAAQRFFIGGGFQNINGGLIMYEAENMDEATKLAQGDPIIQKGIFEGQIYEWNIVIVSKQVEDNPILKMKNIG